MIGEQMPLRIRIDHGFTIAPAPNNIQYWRWNWFGEAGPNKGPVIFAADPKGQPRPTANEALVTYDVAKCRNAPGNDPNAPEIFYEFKIRNESNTTDEFRLEIILFSDLPIQDFT